MIEINWHKSKRAALNNALTIICYICVIIVGFFISWILLTLLSEGLAGFKQPVFTESTLPPGQNGGLLNAIVGSLMMTGVAMLISLPVGLLIAVYLVDLGRGEMLASVIRFFNDVLLSAPSIIMGLFVYTVWVQRVGGFSGIAGAMALAIISLPIIIRAAEDAMLLVCDPLRESAIALGATRWHVAWLICYRGARTGIITAILLSMARILGETAPLLFTALSNNFYSTDMLSPMANLPVVIFNYAMSPYASWQELAWAGALILSAIVLLFSIVARILISRREIR